jgi:uncharacterized protein (DUF488 family)
MSVDRDHVSDPPTILTVGHGTRPVEDLIEQLHSVGALRLVDVRSAPGSRRNPQYGREPLAASLAAADVAYEWRGEDLGGFRRARPDSPHLAIRNNSFRGYADYMDSSAFAGGIDWLVQTSTVTPSAIMCAEVPWWRCHRSMIADALLARGCLVIHLLGDRRQEHRLHPNARLEGTRVVYDVGDQASLEV